MFNILLQVLDDGRLTTGQGVTVDFKNTVIVMTSNLGSSLIQERAGKDDYDTMKQKVLEIVATSFRPEFINRIDETVVFHPLDRNNIKQIADIQINNLRQRLAQKEISIELSEKALDKLSEAGYDPVYGARPLKRAIQTHLENPLAQYVLAGKFVAKDVIKVDVDAGGDLKFA